MLKSMLLRLRKDYLFLAILGVFVAVIFTVAGVPIQRNDAYITLFGSPIALFVMLIYLIGGGITIFYREFNLTISMGVTRKKFFTSHVVCQLLMALEALICFFAITALEKKVYLSFYPERTVNGVTNFIKNPLTWMLIVILFTAIGLFVQSMVLRFGTYARYIILALWVLICVAPGKILASEKILNYLESKKEFLLYIVETHLGLVVTCVCIIPACIFTLIAWLITRKQHVE